MESNIDHVVLNKLNYAVWALDKETLVKSKGLWIYMKISIPDPTDDQERLIVNGKKDEAMGVIMTYISWDIQFHLSGIDFPHQF